MVKTILIFCAHSDDEAAGVGGTILKYIKKDWKIIKVVYSYGEKSQPHLKEKVVAKKRREETYTISDKYGIKETFFFNLPDSKIKENISKPSVKKKTDEIIKKYKPTKIFLPSSKDTHPDHRAVHKAVLNSIKRVKYKKEVLLYEVWNVIEEQLPQIYEDISKEFPFKIEMMKDFKSQIHFIYPLLLPIYFRSKRYGRKNKCKYAERFYKIQ